jgi:DNA-binding response OmpR family regulator
MPPAGQSKFRNLPIGWLAADPEVAMPRILVIDDQPDVRKMISIVLRIHHFEVVEAASGDAGLREFENSSFDLAIVDIFLQGTNGFDVITMMRERVPNLPIVAISGMTTLDFVSGSPELSNVICLQKPFRPNDLVRAIEAAYRKFRSSVAAAKG